MLQITVPATEQWEDVYKRQAFKQARKVVFILEVWLFYSLSSLLSVKRPRSALRTCLNAI